MNGHSYNALTNTLTISRAFEKRSMNPDTIEYAQYYKFRRDIPDADIIVDGKSKVQRDVSTKEMEAYIKHCDNPAARLKEFNRQMILSKVHKHPVKYMQNWFHVNYANYSDTPEYKDGYVVAKTKADMEAARQVSGQTPEALKNQDLGSGQPCPSSQTRKNTSAKKTAA